MTVIDTRITVKPDGTISTTTPLPAGRHAARIEVEDRPARQLTTATDSDELPILDLGPSPEGLSLRRENDAQGRPARVWDELVALTQRLAFGGKQSHDANIIATMLAHGEARLLTFNGTDSSRFGSLIEVVAP